MDELEFTCSDCGKTTTNWLWTARSECPQGGIICPNCWGIYPLKSFEVGPRVAMEDEEDRHIEWMEVRDE